MKELGEIKEHSRKKIELIREYVGNFLHVVENAQILYINEIIFVNRMCNSGTYKSNDKGIYIAILERFINRAMEYSKMKYELNFNDYNKEKIIFLKNRTDRIERPSNIFVYYSNLEGF